MELHDAPSKTLPMPDLAEHGVERGVDNISPLAQVRRMQRVLYERSQKPGIDNRELAQLACAWERLEERKRVMVGKPAPKPIDTTAGRKRVTRASSAAVTPTDASASE